MFSQLGGADRLNATTRTCRQTDTIRWSTALLPPNEGGNV